ncbi:MAD-domain-containing protein [Heliocybe sulcata]|uniref:Spindle assembly checkpoint component MAD1 n=1 Tax=Heliocybe sulcata TaxID=5364 RepID=A0A5C3MLP0_9AGAM|nr:MAD-domain-containing protein [Heliocybe sulcata]
MARRKSALWLKSPQTRLCFRPPRLATTTNLNMDNSKFVTPATRSTRLPSAVRSSAVKRDSLQAELERDPQYSTAKRQQRTQAFTSNLAQASLERQLAAAKTAKTDLEKRLREKDVTIDGLERDRRWLHERLEEEKQAKEQELVLHEEDNRKFENQLRTLRTSHRNLQEEHTDLKEQHDQLSRTTSLTIASQKTRISTLERQVEALEGEVQDLRRLADERSQIIQEVQDRFEDLSVAQESFSRESLDEENWSVIREELHRQVDYIRTLESTNTKLTQEVNALRERYTSVEVLREEKRGLEAKLRALEPLREKVVRLEAEVEAARKEREDWASKNIAASPSQTPVTVTQSLSALRMEHARLLEEHGATVALLHQREKALEEATSRNHEQEETIDKQQEERRVLKDIANRQEQKAMLAEREVGFLQALLASYNAEETEKEGPKLDDVLSQRVQQLESLLADYKARNQELEKDRLEGGGSLRSSDNGPSRQELLEALQAVKEQLAQADKALEDAQAERDKQLEKIDALEQTLFELEGEIGAGRHVPPGARVLSLKENPEQQWFDMRQEVMDRLKSENEALINRLKELEESGVQSSDDAERRQGFVPRESWEAVNEEKLELRETVKQKEKRLMRLQEVFQAKSQEFKDAVGSLLGVKLSFYPNGQVRVTSQYDVNASFVFRPASKEDGGGAAEMQLVAQGEGVPADIEAMIPHWVQDEQCIPGFLSGVTLTCYDRWKENKDQEAQQ